MPGEIQTPTAPTYDSDTDFTNLPADQQAVAARAKKFGEEVGRKWDEAWRTSQFNNAEYIGAGVGFYNAMQKYRASDMGEDAQREIAYAGEEFANAWATAHGMQPGSVRAVMTTDRNGEPHVRLYRGDDNFVTDFSYDNMVSFLKKKGYLDQADADMRTQLGIEPPQTTAAVAPAAKPMTEDDFYKTIKNLPEWAVDDFWEQNGTTVFGEKRSLALRGKYNDWLKTQQEQGASAGGGGKSGGGKTTAADAAKALESGETADGGGEGGGESGGKASVNGNGWDEHSDVEGGNRAIQIAKGHPAAQVNPDGSLKTDSGAKEDVTPEATEKKKPPEKIENPPVGRYDVVLGREPFGPGPESKTKEPVESVAEEASTNGERKSVMIGKYDVSTPEGLAEAQKRMEANGYKVREINGEWYAWIPGAGVWVAGDGHTVRERNGTFVDTGWEPGTTKVVAKNRDVTILANDYDTTNAQNGALRRSRRGVGTQTTAKKIEGKEVVRKVNGNVIKFLQAKNGANEEFLNEKSGTKRTAYSGERGVPEVATRKDKYGNVVEVGIRQNGGTGMFFDQDEETTNREEGRIQAFESGPNGAKGVDTFARRLNNNAHLDEGLRARGITISPAGTEFKAYKDGKEISEEEYFKALDEIEVNAAKEIASQFNSLSDKDRKRLLKNLSEEGHIALQYADAFVGASDIADKQREQLKVISDAWDEVNARVEQTAHAMGTVLRARLTGISHIKDDEERVKELVRFLDQLDRDDRKLVVDNLKANEEYNIMVKALDKAGIKRKRVIQRDEKPKSIDEHIEQKATMTA